MNIVNLTPHTINIFDDSGNEVATVPASGEVARVNEVRVTLEPVAGMPVSRATYGPVNGLPEPKDDTIYIVSSLVLQRTSRADVFAPGPALRDESGRIVGCTGLSAANEAGESVEICYGCEQDQLDVENAIAWLGGMVIHTLPNGWPTYGRVIRKHPAPLVEFVNLLIEELVHVGGQFRESWQEHLDKIITNSVETYTAEQVVEWINRYAGDAYDAGTWSGTTVWFQMVNDLRDNEEIAKDFGLPMAVVEAARK